jgi:hypothetical protein
LIRRPDRHNVQHAKLQEPSMSRQRTGFLVAATLAACGWHVQASAERLVFEGSFDVAVFNCDHRAFECLPDQWLDFVAQPIAPIPFSFTIDVTQVAEQTVVFRSSTWVAPSLVPASLISGSLDNPRGGPIPPFTQATFDELIDPEYSVSRSMSGGITSDGTLQWTAGVGNRWGGVITPAPIPGDRPDELSFRESVSVTLQRTDAGPGGPASFADLVALFDHYLATQRSVDLTAEFGYRRGDLSNSGVESPFSRMGGSFRLASIQCRTSAASNLLAGLRVALSGPN